MTTFRGTFFSFADPDSGFLGHLIPNPDRVKMGPTSNNLYRCFIK